MTAIDVAVVGGGASGLAAAYELHRQGVRFALLDAAPQLGGVIRTDHVDGFTLDAGPDSFLTQKPAAVQLCEELDLGNRLISTLEPRTAYVLRGQLRPIPESSVLGIPTALLPWLTSTLLSPKAKLRMASEIFLPRGDAKRESVGQFFRRRFGQAAVEHIADPLLAGIHAGDVEQLSIAALFPQLVEAEHSHGSVILALRSLRKQTPRSRQGFFRSLPEGLEELVSSLTAKLPSSAVHPSSQVLDLIGPSPYTLQIRSARRLSARSVILATPAHVAATLVRRLDSRLAALCKEIPYTSTATVLLAYPQSAIKRPQTGSGFVVPRLESSVGLLAGSWVTSKWPGRAPPGYALLRGFLGGSRHPKILDCPDEDLVDHTHRSFASLLDIDCRPTLARVYRWNRANAQHNVGHIERMNQIEQRLEQIPGVFLTGAGFHGIGIPDCIADGRAAALASIDWQASRQNA